MKLFIWNALERVLPLLVQLSGILFLTRYINPEDMAFFGVINLVLVVSQVFVDGGVGVYIISKTNVSEIEKSTAFCLSIIIALIFLSLGLGVIELLLNLVGMEGYYSYAVISLTILLFSAFSVVSRALVVKDMRFQLLFKVSMISSVTATLIAIILAELECGLWSLVFHSLLFNSFVSISLFVVAGWIPVVRPSIRVAKRMVPLLGKVFSVNILDVIYRGALPIIIAKNYTLLASGLFTQAQKISELPGYNISQMVFRYTLSRFSSLNRAELNKDFEFILGVTLVLSPIFFGMLAVVSNIFVWIVFDERWMGVGELMSLLFLLCVFLPIRSVISSYLIVVGRSGLNLFIEVISKFLLLMCIIIFLFSELLLDEFLTGLFVVSLILNFGVLVLLNVVFKMKGARIFLLYIFLLFFLLLSYFNRINVPTYFNLDMIMLPVLMLFFGGGVILTTLRGGKNEGRF